MKKSLEIYTPSRSETQLANLIKEKCLDDLGFERVNIDSVGNVIATKGSGETPWSRGADGRLTLKGGVREVLATAMLEALGVETSKSFSLIETGEALVRGDEP